MTPALVALVGALLGPVQRAHIFHFTVERGLPWRNACPGCGRVLVGPGWRRLVSLAPPTGRCLTCSARVGPPPFVVEAVTAVVVGVLALRVDDPLVLVALCWVAAVGVVLAFVDVAVHRLPDQLTYAAALGALALLGVAAVAAGDPVRIGWIGLNGLGLAMFYAALILIHPAGMGLGDAKLALSLGLVLGWFGWVSTVVAAAASFLLAGLVSAALLLLGRVTRKSEIPHGPFMLLGALATVVLVA